METLLDKLNQIEQIINHQQMAYAMQRVRISKEADRKVAEIEKERTTPKKPRKMAG